MFVYSVNATEQAVHGHSHQNGFNAVTATVSSGAQSPSSNQHSATHYTGTPAQATWTGSNTLTYTQSMQPPHHTTYCEHFFPLLTLYSSFCCHSF